jgi:hypothetical protein
MKEKTAPLVSGPRPRPGHLTIAALALVAAACGRGGRGTAPTAEDTAETAPQASRAAASAAVACAHAVCGADFYVDAAPVGACAIGAPCRLSLTLVATGEYHINDEYPYKFRADDAPGVAFLGTDVGGPRVFSKSAQNWTKQSDKIGTMAVLFRPLEGARLGSKAIGGVFKLSVCSKDTCRLEQPELKTTVAIW